MSSKPYKSRRSTPRGLNPRNMDDGTKVAVSQVAVSRAVAGWFISHGLPAFAPRHAHPRNLVARLAPTATFAVVAQVSILITSALMAFILRSPLFDVLDRPASSGAANADSTFAEFVALATLVVPVAGLLLSLLLAWVVSRQREKVRTWLGVVSLAGFVTAPLIARLLADFSGVFSSHPLRILGWMAARIVLVLVALAVVKVGVGAVLASAWQRARNQVSTAVPLAAKALPITILTFLFAYFSAETWQVTAAMSAQRLASVLAILLALALALVVFTTADRVKDLVAQGVDLGAHRDLITDVFPSPRTVTKSQPDTSPTGTSSVPVTRLETINLVILQAVAQLWQALLFALVVWVFLLGFSVAAIPAVTESKWTQMAVQYFTVNDVTLPLTVAYVKVCSLLAAVAALSFAGASATDDFYARSLKADLDREVEQALAIKHCYRAGGAQENTEPAR